jgi:hypothetical protein
VAYEKRVLKMTTVEVKRVKRGKKGVGNGEWG